MGTSAGNRKYIETPEKLWELFLDYVQYQKDNPFIKRTEIIGEKCSEKLEYFIKPITFIGFEAYLAMNRIISNLSSYEANLDGRYEGYVPIIHEIKNICKSNNIDGAVNKLFDSNFTARLYGIKENLDHTTDGEKIKNVISFGGKEIEID